MSKSPHKSTPIDVDAFIDDVEAPRPVHHVGEQDTAGGIGIGNGPAGPLRRRRLAASPGLEDDAPSSREDDAPPIPPGEVAAEYGAMETTIKESVTALQADDGDIDNIIAARDPEKLGSIGKKTTPKSDGIAAAKLDEELGDDNGDSSEKSELDDDNDPGPSPSPSPAPRREFDPPSPGRGGEMLHSDETSIVEQSGVPTLEATLVQNVEATLIVDDEPNRSRGTIYEATLVRQSSVPDSESAASVGEQQLPWWKRRHPKMGLRLMVVVLAVAVIVILVTRGNGDTNEPSTPPPSPPPADPMRPQPPIQLLPTASPTEKSSLTPTRSNIPSYSPSGSPTGYPTRSSVPTLSPVSTPSASPSTNETIYVKGKCGQILEVETLEKFTDIQVGIYQLLMQSYTAEFGYMVAEPQIVTTCEVIGQDLAGRRRGLQTLIQRGLRRRLQNPKLVVEFTMEYKSRYGFDLENYPQQFGAFINANLERVTADMEARFLPVVEAQEVIVLAGPPPTAPPIDNAPEPTMGPEPTAEPTTRPLQTLAPSTPLWNPSTTLAPFRPLTAAPSISNEWSSTSMPCEERVNKGQCEADVEGVECLWIGVKCITIPFPGGS